MIYKFKSQATGDLIMLGPQGDHLLELLGRSPAAKGVIDVADMPAAVRTLEAAVDAEERAAADPAQGSDDERARPERVGLRQRLWPMIEMLRRAQAEGEAIVWGV